ncbi:MAG: shikimate kinase [Clostridiaceae bacterium]|jgi:shikimate kinase|nr:shikimate kinase [Clostridiaceae bacterium]
MKKKNIVLTGIMGCGKSTVGCMLASCLGMAFLDLDQYIEKKWGRIPDLFLKGEEYFRDIESAAVEEISDNENTVIATGGGTVKKDKNIAALKKSGIIFFIDRPIDDILKDVEISERPLLSGGKEKLIEIFRERYHRYIVTCDYHIKDARYLKTVVNEIITIYKNA